MCHRKNGCGEITGVLAGSSMQGKAFPHLMRVMFSVKSSMRKNLRTLQESGEEKRSQEFDRVCRSSRSDVRVATGCNQARRLSGTGEDPNGAVQLNSVLIGEESMRGLADAGGAYRRPVEFRRWS